MLKPSKELRFLFFLIIDLVISIFTLYLSYLLRFNFDIPIEHLDSFWRVFFVVVGFKIAFYFFYKLYFVSWRFFSLFELKGLIFATTISYLLSFVVVLLFIDYFTPFPRSVIIIDYFLSLIFIGFFRISKRLYLEKTISSNPPAVIVGANEKTLSLLKQPIPYTIIDIYETKNSLIGSFIQGFKITDINKLENNPTVIITKDENLDEIIKILKNKNISDIKIYSPFQEKLKDISIEDILARHPKDLDKTAIKNFINNKKILITGAGGSIGSEIVRQCKKYNAKELILVDNSEFNLYSINEEVPSKSYLIDIAKLDFIDEVISVEKPDVIIHAAAYKHVPLCEQNPKSAIINNILGTKNLIDCAIKHKIDRFLLISTDKAVRPTNVMGATKRVCELYLQNVNSQKTTFCAVRFGNVLGSSGSVVPKFTKLIKNNKPLTITHPDITRYFMTIPEACQLVLQASSLAKDRELFILDMGEPVKIVDLAKNMLRLYGKDENNIIFTGLRNGEKLYEELLINDSDKKTQYEDILIAKKDYFDINLLNKLIDELIKLKDNKSIKLKLKEIVKEYKPVI